MRIAILFLCMTLLHSAPAIAHERCDTFPTYADAVRHCKTATLHQGKAYCGSHDRDRDGRPCECNPGGPEADTQACKSKRKKK